MKTNLKTMTFLLLALVGAMFTACQQDEDLSSTESKGKVTFLMTDAPFPSEQVAAVNVVIDRIEIRKVSDSEVEESADFFVVSEGTQEFNLLDLRNGVTTQIGEAMLDTGVYDQIRLHIVESEIVLNDEANTVYDLKIPSGASSGLKINIMNGLEVDGGSTHTLVLDFDVSKSFVVQGNPNTNAGIKGFIFKPVLRAIVEDISGSIEGTVTTGEAKTVLPNVSVSIMQDTTVVSTAITDDKGYYAVIGLLPGNYKIKTQPQGYQLFEQADIPVEKQKATVVDITLVPVPATPPATN
ncbi:MAG: DUF4382 domain-containing protein [Prolixibacteraceae bacterium]